MKYIAWTLLISTIGIFIALIIFLVVPYFGGIIANNYTSTSIYNAEQRIKESEQKINNSSSKISSLNYELTEEEKQQEIIIMLKRLYLILEETKNSNINNSDLNLDIDIEKINQQAKNIENSDGNDAGNSEAIKNSNSKNLENPEKIINFPSDLLIDLSPEIYPVNISNDGIFGLYLFNDLEFSTYLDEKNDIKFYIIDEKYSTLKNTFGIVDKIYSINETNEYYSGSFFLNPLLEEYKDDNARLIINISDNKTIGIVTPKSRYDFLKNILITK